MPHDSHAAAYRLDSVKVCGITSVSDRDLVADAGASYFGVLIDVGSSPRTVTLQQAKKLFDSPPIPGVAVLFNAGMDQVRTVAKQLQPFAVQLTGKEKPEVVAALKSELSCEVWKSLYVPPKGRADIDLESLRLLGEEYEDSGADTILYGTLDTSGGLASVAGDWGVMRALMKDMVVPGYLAGGLNSDNVISAIMAVHPQGIDVCTGVESTPGRKDPSKLARFMKVLEPYR